MKRCSLAQVPPYCYMAGGRSHEEATIETMKVLRSRYAIDALSILWQLRRSCGTNREPNQQVAGDE